MSIIKNSTELCTTAQREDAVAIIEAGLEAIDTVAVLRTAVTVTDGVLRVGGKSYVLDEYEKVFIIGFGKVSCTAARTLETILAGQVDAGAVIGVKEQVCAVVDTYAGTHPLPSSVNYTATKHIEALAKQATERDLVLVVVSGGGSALLCSSMGECEQGSKLFASFLSSGGTIEEMNTVRKHISTLKGGGLAAVLHPATVIGLIFSDVPGGDLAAVASGPTFYDESTKEDAADIIARYSLGEYTLQETPKDESLFERVHNVAIVSNELALAAMARRARELGYDTAVHSSMFYGTPEEVVGLVTAHTAPATALLIGGEPRLTIPDGCTGKGGRNDYVALATLDSLAPGQLVASVASDGRDNTEAAGALVDGATNAAADAKAIRAAEYTECLNSYPFFEEVGGHIKTGVLESNVSDLLLILNKKTDTRTDTVATDVCISGVSATVIKDSRQKPTIAVTVQAGIYSGTFSVPSGASTGEREVVAVAAKTAVKHIKRSIAPALKGVPVTDQSRIDAILHSLDKTPQFSSIGGNTTLGVSVAACKAAAASLKLEVWEYIRKLFPLPKQAPAPRLFVNLINGGAHAKYGSDIQEHQIIPETDNPREAFVVASAVQRALRDVLEAAYAKRDIGIGDEGGFVIPSTTTEEPFRYLRAAVAAVAPTCPVSFGTDVAATSFCTDSQYTLNGETFNGVALAQRLSTVRRTFPELRYIEDPADENDVATFTTFSAMNPDCTVIGDDITTTSRDALRTVVEKQAINGIIIKPNQIGTVSDTLATMKAAYERNVRCIVSHRSGETMDDFIADLAFGTQCYGLKAGAPLAPERRVKYERLLTIAR